MLSIIVCSRYKTLPKEFVDNVADTIGIDYEVIAIDNSKNEHSIFSAYNKGLAKAQFPNVCFVHEDVFFHTKSWGQIVLGYLQDPKTGIIGLAGGDLVTRVPAAWSACITQSINIIQSDRTGKRPTKTIKEPENWNQTKRSVITLDGVFMCMRRDLFEKIRFDEKLAGFHGYDFDISVQSTVAGYTNYVIYNIELEHFSRGSTNDIYFRNLVAIFKKWGSNLPLMTDYISEQQPTTLQKIEIDNLLRLIKKMARKGINSNEIISSANYFAAIIGAKREVRCLRMRIFLIRLFNSPKYLLKK